MTTHPAVVALLDQAQAAAQQTGRMLTDIANQPDRTVKEHPHGPAVDKALTRLRTLHSRGQLTLCPHLSYTAHAPAYWTPWAPGRLRCAQCSAATARRIQGTREDLRCDNCQRVSPNLVVVAIELPPVVLEMAGHAPTCVPPILVTFGLCRPCQAAEAVAA